DAVAIRASGFSRRDPGYIENVTTGQQNVNQADVAGGHFSGVWRISEAISLKVGALLQNTDGDGISAVETNSRLQPTLGEFKQAYMPGTEQYSLKVRLYTASLEAKP